MPSGDRGLHTTSPSLGLLVLESPPNTNPPLLILPNLNPLNLKSRLLELRKQHRLDIMKPEFILTRQKPQFFVILCPVNARLFLKTVSLQKEGALGERGLTSSLVCGTNSKDSRSFQRRTPTRRRGRITCSRIKSANRASQVDNGSRESNVPTGGFAESIGATGISVATAGEDNWGEESRRTGVVSVGGGVGGGTSTVLDCMGAPGGVRGRGVR
jgi:hypothetical protein